MSETFLVAWRRLDSVPDAPKPWLLAVARRVLANQRRSSGRQSAVQSRLEASDPDTWCRPDVERSGDAAVLDALAELADRGDANGDAWYGPAVRWGLSISLSGDLADPSLVADVALAAEQAGWDGVFVWDHLWNRTMVPFADPFVTLAAIAMATERVVIGTMVTALPRRRPQLVAQSTTSLDRLSHGRMVLGLGLGVDSYGEYSVFDEPAVDDRARAAALDAGIGLLEQMLAGEPVTGAGGRVTTPASVQQPRVPIWIAGRAALSAGPRRVRRHGLEGLALVDADSWTPQHVTTALSAGDLSAGEMDVALVGGSHPDPEALGAAGATWCFSEILPGATATEALAIATRRPG